MLNTEELKKAFSGMRMLENAELKGYTSFRTGGTAGLIVFPENTEDYVRLVQYIKESDVPYVLLGNGSNVLVSDKGFDGLVIVTRENAGDICIDGNRITAAAGCSLSRVAMEAARAGLAGMEFAAGIPGSVGGAVVMNAGAYGGEISDCIDYAEVIDPEGSVLRLTRAQLELSYRHSCIPEKNYIVTEASFILENADKNVSLEKIAELAARRREKQPLEYPSAGSTFKRPEGFFAGKLIEDAGLKGYSVGDACVSEKHCGFVINKGCATSSDIYRLIMSVQKKVAEAYGIELEPEVKFIGDFSDVVLE